MNEFLTYIFDEEILKNLLRPEWIKYYDFNYVDKKIIGGLMKTKLLIQDLLDFILNKAKVGNISNENIQKKESQSNEDLLSEKTIEDKTQQPQKLFQNNKKKLTVPEPFNLSENKPRMFQQPIQIPKNFIQKPLPLADYSKTSLNDIEEKRKDRLNAIKSQVLEKYNKIKPPEFQSEKRPMNKEKIKEEVEKKIVESLQFNNKYVNPPLDYSKIDADVKYNEAAIIRENYLIEKNRQKEENELKKILIEKKDSKEFDRWQNEMKLKDDIEKEQLIHRRKLELELNREIATNFMKNKIKENQLKNAEHKKQEEINLKNRLIEKEKDILKNKELVKEINKDKEKIIKNKIKLENENKELYKRKKAEFNELNLIRIEEKKIEQKRRDDLIRQIRELEKIPVKRTSGFDPTETPGYGILEEMSIVELKERLELQKKFLKDQIEAKREENKLKSEERTEDLIAKANNIADFRDKLRNQKEIEKKQKRDLFEQKQELFRQMREKNLYELKEKMQNKKDELRKEDEIFQKKIREINLQRQFLQQGRAAVEQKRFKQIEDGMERKVNNRQNQDLIDQYLKEKVDWQNVKIRYNNIKQNVDNSQNLFNNYKNAYLKSSFLNDIVNAEDNEYKTAMRNRERAIAKFQKDKVISKYKFSDMLQENTLKKNVVKSENLNKGKMNVLNKNISIKNDNLEQIEEFNDVEENPIANKLENENSAKEATMA
jgi:hypothetical protein